jgi:hypothetical protein
MANENVPIDESKAAKQGNWKRWLLIPLLPLAVAGFLIAFGAILLIIAVCLPFLAVKGFFRECSFQQASKTRSKLLPFCRKQRSGSPT